MKRSILYICLSLLTLAVVFACGQDDPIDANGLLITQRSQSYMTSFDLLGTDHRTVLVSGQTKVDTTALTVTAIARFGTNMSRLKPICSVVTDAIVEPNMGVWTDFSQAQTYTVVSGNRQVRKTYTVTVTLQK